MGKTIGILGTLEIAVRVNGNTFAIRLGEPPVTAAVIKTAKSKKNHECKILPFDNCKQKTECQ